MEIARHARQSRRRRPTVSVPPSFGFSPFMSASLPPFTDHFAPIAIGLCLTLIHLISIPVTNTSVNPARSTGPALLVGGWALAQLWLFWLAPILGGIIGIERQFRHKPAGLRTNMLICFGSAMFTVLSSQLAGSFGGDHTRIAFITDQSGKVTGAILNPGSREIKGVKVE